MTERRKVITGLIGSLVVCTIGLADMMPLCPTGVVCPQPAPLGTPADFRPASLSSPWPDLAGVAAEISPLFESLLLPDAETEPIDKIEPARILVDRQNSLTLCLYGLMGLGLCHSAPFLKRFQFSGIPDWYYSGRPFQVGPRSTISPDCLPLAAIHAFIPPDCHAVEVASQYLSGVIAMLLRESLFIPISLTSRGPPSDRTDESHLT